MAIKIKYKIFVTKLGYEKLNQAIESIETLDLSIFQFADSEQELTEDTTALDNIVYTNYITHKEKITEKRILLQTVIPVWDGGFNVNRIGIIDKDHDLIMVGIIPNTYVPSIDEGATKEIVINVGVNVDSADNISIKIDPTVTLVTQEKLTSELEHILHLIDNKVEYSELDDAIAELVGEAPEMLDTLQELADALDNDPNFATTMTKELSKKVDKEDGKGLSSNDFTDELKNKLEVIEHITRISQLKQDIPYLLDKDLNPLREDIADNTNLINSEIDGVITIIESLDIPEHIDLTPIIQDIESLKENKLSITEFESTMSTILDELYQYLEEEFTKTNKLIDSKADKIDIPKVLADLEDGVDLMNRVTKLESESATKAELNQVKDDLINMVENIDIPEVDLSEIEEELARLESVKANKKDVEESLSKIIFTIEKHLEEQLITINQALELKADQTEIERLEKTIKDIITGEAEDRVRVIPYITDTPVMNELYYKQLEKTAPVTHWYPDDWGVWEVINQKHLKCKSTSTYDALTTRISGNKGIVRMKIVKDNQRDRHRIRLVRDGETIVDIRETRGDKEHELKVKPGDQLTIISLFGGDVYLDYEGEPGDYRLYAYKNGVEERIANAYLVEKELEKYVTREEADSKIGDLDELKTNEKVIVDAINELNDREVDLSPINDKLDILDKTKADKSEMPTKGEVGVKDTRNIQSTPESFMKSDGEKVHFEFKSTSSINNPPVSSSNNKYSYVMTFAGWRDSSGGYPLQLAWGVEGLAFRQAVSNTQWGQWRLWQEKHINDAITSNSYEFIVKDGVPYLQVAK